MQPARPLVIHQPQSHEPDWSKVVPASGGKPQFKSWNSSGESLKEAKFGVWEAACGEWDREITEREFCHIVSGKATFTSPDGTVNVFAAGDSVYFPENTRGRWRVEEPLRKVFITT